MAWYDSETLSGLLGPGGKLGYPTVPGAPQPTAFQGLLQSPTFNIGMGLLAARQDRRINPFTAAMGGLASASKQNQAFMKQQQEEMAYQQQQQAAEQEQRLLQNFIQTLPPSEQMAARAMGLKEYMKYKNEIAERAQPTEKLRTLSGLAANPALLEMERSLRRSGATTVQNYLGEKGQDAFYNSLLKEEGKRFSANIDLYENQKEAYSDIDEARKLVEKGIITGFWGPTLLKAAKATGTMDDKVANTEAFMSAMGNRVIKRMREFGGNDTVEEMRYMKAVEAGEISLNPKAIVRVLNRAEEKIQRRMKRLGKQIKKMKSRGTGYVSPAIPDIETPWEDDGDTWDTTPSGNRIREVSP